MEGAPEKAGRKQRDSELAIAMFWDRMNKTNYSDESIGYKCDISL